VDPPTQIVGEAIVDQEVVGGVDEAVQIGVAEVCALDEDRIGVGKLAGEGVVEGDAGGAEVCRVIEDDADAQGDIGVGGGGGAVDAGAGPDVGAIEAALDLVDRVGESGGSAAAGGLNDQIVVFEIKYAA